MAHTFDTPIHTGDQSIDRVLSAGLPVLLVFLDGSTSKELEEAYNRLARRHAGEILVALVRTGDNPESVRRYGVSTTPAVVPLKKGDTSGKAEPVSPAVVAQYGDYLLGRASKPQAPSIQQEQHAQTSAQSTYGSTGTSYRTPDQGRATGQPQHVTDATFEREVFKSPYPVLVDFWAPWCGPCRMTDPILEKLAREMPTRLKIAKVNVDENPATAQRYGVQGIPTMMIVKNGKIVDQWVGALPEPAIRTRLSRHI